MVDVKIWLWNGEPCWHVLFAKKARPNHIYAVFFLFSGRWGNLLKGIIYMFGG